MSRSAACRYTCGLEPDLDILADPQALAAVAPRTQAAIVARADEKAVWALLQVRKWWFDYLNDYI